MRLLFTYQDGSLVSWLISWATSAPCSHVGVELDGGDVVSAETGGVTRQPRAAFLAGGRRIVADATPLPATQARLDVPRLVSFVGRPYDYDRVAEDAVGLGFARLFGRAVRMPVFGKRAFDCSELAISIDRRREVPSWRKLDRHAVTPGDMLAACLLAPSEWTVTRPTP
jgi:hypothetical protein